MTTLQTLTEDRIRFFNREYDAFLESIKHINVYEERRKLLAPWEGRQRALHNDAFDLFLLDEGFTEIDIKELRETYVSTFGYMACLFIIIYMTPLHESVTSNILESHKEEFQKYLTSTKDYFEMIHKAKAEWAKSRK